MSNDVPGLVDGRHFTTYVEEVKELESRDELQAELLLLRLVDATESESKIKDLGVAPWYYERLAIGYRKSGNHEAEVQILERFAAQEHALGVKPAKLLERLRKLKSD